MNSIAKILKLFNNFLKINKLFTKLYFNLKRQKTMQKYLINFKTIEWQQKIPGIKFKEYNVENKKIRLAEFTDELIEEEWCKNGHLGYVIEGKAKVVFHNGSTTIFKKGDFINIPEGEKDKHKTKIARGEKALILFYL